MTKQVTIGERIDELTEKYCQLYDRFQSPDFDFIEDKKAIAIQDLRAQHCIYENAIENVKQYIEEKKSK